MTVKLITFAACVFAGGVLFTLAIINLSNTPVFYYSEENPQIEFKYDNGYYLNGEKLQREERTFSEIISSGWERVKEVGYLGIPGTVCITIALILSQFNPIPPVYFLPRMFGIKRKSIIGNISLKQAPGGLIAVREWKINRKGYLVSLNQYTIWHDLNLKSDISPDTKNWKGIYACRLGIDNSIGPHTIIAGIVCLTGRVVGHKDGIVRAENCQILLLFTKKQKYADRLKEHYDCPIIVSSKPTEMLTDWVISQEGIFWLQHNDNLIMIERRRKFENDISNIPAYQTF